MEFVRKDQVDSIAAYCKHPDMDEEEGDVWGRCFPPSSQQTNVDSSQQTNVILVNKQNVILVNKQMLILVNKKM